MRFPKPLFNCSNRDCCSFRWGGGKLAQGIIDAHTHGLIVFLGIQTRREIYFAFIEIGLGTKPHVVVLCPIFP